MTAAATAAGYLYAHGLLPKSDAQAHADSSHRTAKSQSSRRLEPKTFPWQVQSQPFKQVRTPRIEYRKRRFHAATVHASDEDRSL
jgi:hypothetical protein